MKKSLLFASALALLASTVSAQSFKAQQFDGRLEQRTALAVTPLTKKDLAEQQDFFELDENGDIRVKGNRGFYSNSFISALGKDSTGTGGGGSGFDVLRMWQELKADNAANQIHISHLRDALSGYALLEDLYWNIIND